MKNNRFKISSIHQSGIIPDNYSKLQNITPAAHFILSVYGKIITLNTYGLELLGNTLSQVVGYKFSSFISNKQKSIFNSFLKELLSTKTTLSCELNLNSVNSISKHISIAGSILNQNEISITVIDITKRISEDSTLRKNEALLREITEL